jgi:trimeric autotransporter adhesin
MQKRPTLVVLVALLCIFGYFTWEHFSEKKHKGKEKEHEEKVGEDDMDKDTRQDGIDLAMAYEIELTKDPALNRVPRERLMAADNYRKQKLAAFNSSRTTTAISGISWSERGPNNVGGRTRAIMYDLNDAGNGYKKVFAGSVGGGLWVTNDITAGTPTWTRLDDFMGNLAISTLAQDPSNSQNIYAGTGEGWGNVDFIQGLGIWKSTNGGASWSQIASTNNSTFYFVQKVVVTSTGVVLAATRNGGVQRSTNGGSTWTKVLGNGTGGGSNDRAADLEIGNDGNIYCSIGIFSTDGIYRSTDGGVNWTKIYTSAADEERIELACAPTDQNRIYALLHDNNAPNTDGIKKIMSTSDATAATPTWNTLTTPTWCDQGTPGTDFTRSQAWYDLIAAVDPSNANTVFIGGVDIMKSTDAGNTWSQITRWSTFGGCAGADIHADNHAIIFKPGSPTEFLAGNDGGIYRTADAGINFTSRVTGYNVTQFYATAIHPTLTNYFLAGAQDNGTQKFSSAGINNASNATGGDGGFCHIDQDNANIQITSYVYKNFYVSTNGGTSFSPKSFGGSGTTTPFINPSDYDDNANILYAGNINGNYFRWNDAGTGGSNTDNVTVTNFGTAGVRHVAVSPLTSNRVYFGLSNGSVVKVDNANTGTALTGTVIRTGTGSVSCIAIDPANEDHILVTYSNYGVTSIYESLNANQALPTWTAVEGNLPDMPVRWAMFDPRNSDWALIATDLGVWSTDNLNGASTDWDPTNSGLANVRVDMLQYRASDRTIAAATHGRGLFTAVVPISTTPDISFASSSAATTELTTSTNGCRSYTDYSINMQIANAPTGDATVTVAIQGGATATQGIDYEFTTNGNFASPSNSLVFTNGSTASKTINLRIYDDAEVEAAQTFTLTYTISGTTNAQAGSANQTYTFTINDNDSAPTGASSVTYTLGTNDLNSTTTSPFQGGNKKAKTQFLITASELTAAGLMSNRQITALAWNVATKLSTNAYNGFTISMANTSATNLNTGFVSTSLIQVYSNNYTVPGTGWQTITFTTPFSWDGTSNILVQACFDNGNATSAADALQVSNAPLGTGVGASTWIITNAGGTAGCSLSTANIYSLARPIFNFIQSIPQTPIESALNSTKSVYLGPNADAYLYSSADGELIGRIQNLSSHDYGCTSIQIDRAGTGSSQFWNTNTANYLMNKTFRVIPTNNNSSGQYAITLYLSSAEVTGWQTATGQSWANIQLIKLPSQISNVTPTTPEPDGVGTVQVVTPTLGTLGIHYSLTYTFSNGFSGFGAGIPGAQGTLPIKLLSFTGKLQSENVKLNWSTSFEQNSKGFEIEKSLDGINFRKIGFVAGAGNSNSTRNYSFTDPQRAVESNYYRLKLVDIDNTFDYSDVVLVKNAFGKQDVYLAGNPITNSINIQFAKTPDGRVAVSIYDMRGSKIYDATYNNYTQTSLQINTSNKLLAHGVYSIKVETGGKIYNLKAIK